MNSIVEIIPKITSPLAVICFGIYIFYLFKRSEDRKKEKSLQVSDNKAQKLAADKILNDYPDIKIDKIKDSQHVVELAKKIIDDKLRKYHKTTNTLLIFSGIFALTFLSSMLIGKFAPDSAISTDNTEKQEKTQERSWALVESEKESRPYASTSIIQHVKLRDMILSDGSKKRVAEFRNYYSIYAMRDITNTEDVFEEQFLTNSATVQPWPGSDHQEIESITDGRYWVKFDLKKNESKTIVTGANYIYSFPIPNGNSTSCFGEIVSSANEWMTCYPNSTDHIDNLVIMVEAEGISINLPPDAKYRKAVDGAITKEEGSCKVFSSNKNCTLIAKWEKVRPGECLGFKINWSLPQ